MTGRLKRLRTWVVLFCETIVTGGLGKACPGMDDGPLVGITGSEVPGSRAAHGETHEGDAILVDAVLAADGLDGLHDVGLAGRLVADALAAEGVEDDAVFDREIPRAGHALVDEVEIGGLVAAPMEPDVEGDGTVELQLGGNLEAVGLYGVVDLRAEPADDEAL